MDSADTIALFANDACSEPTQYVTIARRIINEATALEQEKHWDKALKKLEIARKEAERILNQVPDTSEELVHSINSAIDDIKSVRQEILQHISICNEKLSSYVELLAPPSYEEVMSTTSSVGSDYQDGLNSSSMNSNLSYSDLGAVLENLKTDTGAQSTQLIYSCNGVMLYFISSIGTVSVSSGPDTVRIFEVEDGERNTLPKYYLQIYTFVYPLVPQISPCIRTEFGAIVLPNINVESRGGSEMDSIGLVVPKDKELEFIMILENILQTKIVFCDTKASETAGTKISDTIMAGAECVSKLLITGAQKAEQFMDGTTPKIIEKINPTERTRRVSPCFSNGIKIAKDVTAVTANVTGFVASKVGAATMSFGQFLAPHLRRKGSKFLSSKTGMDEKEACKKIDTVINITASAVGGLSTVYSGLEKSARIFGRSLSNNTVQIVKHKYGSPTAEFTQDTFETVSNGVEIGTNIKFFKPTSLAMNAAKGIVVTENTKLNSDERVTKSGATKESSKVNSQTLNPFPTSGKLVEMESGVVSSSTSSAASSIGTPVAFSSEILQPTIVSPTYPSSQMMQAGSNNCVNTEPQQKANLDLLS